MRAALILLIALSSTLAFGEVEKKAKFRKAQDLDFEKMLIEGDLKRPEVGVVTGDADERLNILLRLRGDFVDKMAKDLGESVP